MAFMISALAAKQFSKLEKLTEMQLAAQGIKSIIADANPGYPCRVSLCDAAIGDHLFLLNYCHHDHNTPYRATHAIYVCAGAQQAKLTVNTIPESIKTRLISVRGFNRNHDMICAEVTDGHKLGGIINDIFENLDIAYLHLHNAKPGCYAARVDRA